MSDRQPDLKPNARSLGLFALSSAGTMLALGFSLWILHRPYAATPEFYARRLEFFWRFGALFAVLVPISTTSLTQGSRADADLLSKLGSLALVWPLISFAQLLIIPIATLAPMIQGIPLVGITLGIITFIRSIVTRRNWGNSISIPLNAAWIWVSHVYGQEWWLIYGD